MVRKEERKEGRKKERKEDDDGWDAQRKLKMKGPRRGWRSRADDLLPVYPWARLTQVRVRVPEFTLGTRHDVYERAKQMCTQTSAGNSDRQIRTNAMRGPPGTRRRDETRAQGT